MAATRRETKTPRAFRSDIETAAFPVREYIGAMALEMAHMARDEGDGRLAELLEQAAGAAGKPAA